MMEILYASGEIPLKGDVIEYSEINPIIPQKEQGETWIVTSIVQDMVRAKCEDAETWRQSFYVSNMKLIHRKGAERL